MFAFRTVKHKVWLHMTKDHTLVNDPGQQVFFIATSPTVFSEIPEEDKKPLLVQAVMDVQDDCEIVEIELVVKDKICGYTDFYPNYDGTIIKRIK